MESIKFLITNKFGAVPIGIKNTIVLIWDDWNDYSYYTVFGVAYFNNNGEKIEIGTVRIAYFGQKTGREHKLLKINDQFDYLDETYFSLGATDTYYENLNLLGDDIRTQVLVGLRDIAYNTKLYQRAVTEDVTLHALLRDITFDTVTNQYKRIANGGTRLTNYNFSYHFPQKGMNIKPSHIDFFVFAEQDPPTNIQIIIGRNGVGKSHLLNKMIDSILTPDADTELKGRFIFNNSYENESFTNLICVTFSAFDDYFFYNKPGNSRIKYHYVGVRSLQSIEKISAIDGFQNFADEFTSSIGLIISSSKAERWRRIISILESDPIFKEEKCIEIIDKYNANKLKLVQSKFSRLSSGHKIVLLTITKLVELSIEKSLIFFDEPETHLHPPLLSSFIRALSELLTNRNAVCIMTTHSPIVLQEVPKSCVYKLSRNGNSAKIESLRLETFGENVGVLTNDIFGLEVIDSGFYNILKELVENCDTYEEALHKINLQLGIEGRSILRSMFFDKLK